MINREINHRYLLVKLKYHDRDATSLVIEATKAIAEKASFDQRKYHLEWGGQFEGQRHPDKSQFKRTSKSAIHHLHRANSWSICDMPDEAEKGSRRQ